MTAKLMYVYAHHTQMPKIATKLFWQSSDHHIWMCATLAKHLEKTRVFSNTLSIWLRDG